MHGLKLVRNVGHLQHDQHFKENAVFLARVPCSLTSPNSGQVVWGWCWNSIMWRCPVAMWHRPLFVWNEKILSGRRDRGDDSRPPPLPAKVDQSEWGRWVVARLKRLMAASAAVNGPSAWRRGLRLPVPDATVRKSRAGGSVRTPLLLRLTLKPKVLSFYRTGRHRFGLKRIDVWT